MNLSELNHFLAGRTSVRQYLPEPVPDKVIWEILKATNKAPSAGNLESWDVIVVTDEGTRELLSDAAFLQEHVSAAPVVFVICAIMSVPCPDMMNGAFSMPCRTQQLQERTL